MWRFFLRTGKLREWSPETLQPLQPLHGDGSRLRVVTLWSLGAHVFGEGGSSRWPWTGVRVASIRECAPTGWWPWTQSIPVLHFLMCTGQVIPLLCPPELYRSNEEGGWRVSAGKCVQVELITFQLFLPVDWTQLPSEAEAASTCRQGMGVTPRSGLVARQGRSSW